MPSTPPVDPASSLTKGELTRQQILDAAVQRFGNDGFRSTSVADIARGVGVGGTVAYAYFENKEALFLAALDQDAAGVIQKGMGAIPDEVSREEWRNNLLFTLIDAVEEHPLARRVLAGLEPSVTDRMIDIPALAQLRKAVSERLAEEQKLGLVRTDLDPEVIGNGSVTVFLSLLMTAVQFGMSSFDSYGGDVLAFMAAATDPPASKR